MNKKKPSPKIIPDLETIDTVTEKILEEANKKRVSVLKRYPLLFLGLSTFGFAAMLHGFEQFILSIPYLATHPLVVFWMGVATLLFTGSLFKKLQ